MANYTVIADVGRSITDMLKEKMVPEPVSKAESIGICDPKERGGFIVGIHPYDISENSEVRRLDPVLLPDGRLQNPSTSYNISYMISVVSKSEIATRALDEQRMLGKIVQIMADNKKLPQKYMTDSLRASNDTINIEMKTLQLEDKIKIWSMFSEPYKLSVFYTVSPIIVDSEVIKIPAKRVTTVEISQNQK